MVTASPAVQRELVRLQDLDSQIARLGHQRSTLPVLEVLRDLDDHGRRLNDNRVRLETEAADRRREMTRTEDEIELVAARAARHNDRLMSASAKEAQALQTELEQLARRTSDLEDQQLAQMEVIDGLETELAGVQEALSELGGRISAAEEERDREQADLTSKLNDVALARQSLTEGMPADLLELYGSVRESVGGLAVLALYGSRTEPAILELSASELASVRSAPEDEVVVLEEHGYIVVRMD